jgi:hypothetical protein
MRLLKWGWFVWGVGLGCFLLGSLSFFGIECGLVGSALACSASLFAASVFLLLFVVSSVLMLMAVRDYYTRGEEIIEGAVVVVDITEIPDGFSHTTPLLKVTKVNSDETVQAKGRDSLCEGRYAQVESITPSPRA